MDAMQNWSKQDRRQRRAEDNMNGGDYDMFQLKEPTVISVLRAQPLKYPATDLSPLTIPLQIKCHSETIIQPTGKSKAKHDKAHL
jgi:hypothetical protein